MGVTITSGAVSRTYAIFVPASYNPTQPLSLVFAFHGDGGTGSGFRTSLGMETRSAGAAKESSFTPTGS